MVTTVPPLISRSALFIGRNSYAIRMGDPVARGRSKAWRQRKNCCVWLKGRTKSPQVRFSHCESYQISVRAVSCGGNAQSTSSAAKLMFFANPEQCAELRFEVARRI